MYLDIESCDELKKINNEIIEKANEYNNSICNKINFDNKSSVGKLLILKDILRKIISLNYKSKKNFTGYSPFCATIDLKRFADKLLNTNTSRNRLKVDVPYDKPLFTYCDKFIKKDKVYTETEIIKMINDKHLILENNYDNYEGSLLHYCNRVPALKYINVCLESGNEYCSLWGYLATMFTLYPNNFADVMYNTSKDLLKSIIKGKEKDNLFLQARKTDLENTLRISGVLN